MIFLLSAVSKLLPELLPEYPGCFGFLGTPDNGAAVETVVKLNMPVALDNGAYSGFHENRYQRMLTKWHGQKVLWVTAPDVVANAKVTYNQFSMWSMQLRAMEYPVAYVLQDGQEDFSLPDADCYFVGGTTEFKLSQTAYDLVREGQRRNAWIHMGRVNTYKRLQIASQWGCDSVDGNKPVYYSKAYLRQFANWVKQLNSEQQLTLF